MVRNANSFGGNLKALRESRNMTQKVLARKSGVSAIYISELETGKKANPSLEVSKKLAAALKITLDSL